MKRALYTILMLTISLTSLAQNATKVVILDTYNKGGKLRQSTLSELKSNLAQCFTETYGFEGVINEKVDNRLRANGFTEHPRLSEEQAKQVVNLTGTQFGLMSEASVDDFGYLTVKTVLINLNAYQIMATESTSMNNTPEHIRKGCGKMIQKIVSYLPKPAEPIVEEKIEPEEPEVQPEPLKPQKLTANEAEQVSRLLNRADVCIEMNYVDNAIKEYEKIVEIAPGWANVYMYLGNTYVSKGDALSLQKAKENYNKFLQLTDDQDLYYEAQDKLSRVEMMTELRGKEDENAENLVGVWKSEIYDAYTGRPWFVIDIAKTSVSNKYQIVLSPKSMMYNNIVNTKAYTEVIDGKIGWSFSFQDTYIPSQSKYNIEGAMVNYLFNAGSFASLVGNIFVESARENDVGYTNIMDFDFITDANVKDVQDEYYKEFSEKMLEGSCQMKGEHHQSGRNNVELDTVRECNFLRGDGLYPVYVKVKEVGGDYLYGDIKLTDKNTIINYSPYISKNEFDSKYRDIKTTSIVFGVIGGVTGGLLLDGLIINSFGGLDFDGLATTPPFTFGKTFLVVNGVISGLSLITCFVSKSQWNKYLEQCYSIHNKKVDENIRKFRQNDQANVSLSVGLTPAGVGVSLNF